MASSSLFFCFSVCFRVSCHRCCMHACSLFAFAAFRFFLYGICHTFFSNCSLLEVRCVDYIEKV